MFVDVIAQFNHKQDSARWLSEHWLTWSDAQLALKAQFATLKADKKRIRDFENRCVEALGRSVPDTDNTSRINRFVRDAVQQVAGTKPSMRAYTEARRAYNIAHREAWTAYGSQRNKLRTLQAHTKRYGKRFGFEREDSVLADHLDRTRDEERWSFLDAFFAEREMPGHNQFVCPVCATVAKDGQVSEHSITSTSYADARCRNFDCSRYGERLITLDSFQTWFRYGNAEANGLGQERFEYEREFGWQAREDAKLAEQATRAELHELVQNMSPRMQDVRQRALEATGLFRAHPRTVYAEKRDYSRKQPPLAMPVRGAEADGSCEWVEETNPYLNRKRPYTHLRAVYMHRKPARWEPDYGFESPECWDYSLNPNAVGVQSYGSLVTAH